MAQWGPGAPKVKGERGAGTPLRLANAYLKLAEGSLSYLVSGLTKKPKDGNLPDGRLLLLQGTWPAKPGNRFLPRPWRCQCDDPSRGS
jgi:hypothetical protein